MALTGTEPYYQRRAHEYDKVYAKPERQTDLEQLATLVGEAFVDEDVLEVAAGTGYWTRFYVDTARSVRATDINDEVLDVARARRQWPDSTTFEVANAFELNLRSVDGTVAGSAVPPDPSEPTAAFAGFFWSHLLLDQADPFLTHLVECLAPESKIVFIDNRYVEGSNHPITETDSSGNTYQQRKLDDGTSWRVLKNFPTPAQIQDQLSQFCTNVSVVELDYFWIAQATTKTR